jgi:hypothetical protein
MELGSNPNLHFEFISDRTIEADVNPPIPLEITKSKERKNMKIENKVRVIGWRKIYDPPVSVNRSVNGSCARQAAPAPSLGAW